MRVPRPAVLRRDRPAGRAGGSRRDGTPDRRLVGRGRCPARRPRRAPHPLAPIVWVRSGRAAAGTRASRRSCGRCRVPRSLRKPPTTRAGDRPDAAAPGRRAWHPGPSAGPPAAGEGRSGSAPRSPAAATGWATVGSDRAGRERPAAPPSPPPARDRPRAPRCARRPPSLRNPVRRGPFRTASLRGRSRQGARRRPPAATAAGSALGRSDA